MCFLCYGFLQRRSSKQTDKLIAISRKIDEYEAKRDLWLQENYNRHHPKYQELLLLEIFWLQEYLMKSKIQTKPMENMMTRLLEEVNDEKIFP
jgi:hypothetical protein